MIGRVVERRGDDVNSTSSHERPGDESSDDLALRTCQRDGEAVGDRTRRRRLREEGGGDREDVESAVEGNSSSRSSGRLTQSDVGDGSGAGEDNEADVLAAAESRDGVDDVASAGDFQNVRAHGGLRIPGYDDGRFGLVLGAGRAASGPPDDFNRGAVASGGVVGVRNERLGCGAATGAASVFFLGSLRLTFADGSNLKGVGEVVVVVVLLLLLLLLLVGVGMWVGWVLVVKLREHVLGLALGVTSSIFTFHLLVSLFINIVFFFVCLSSGEFDWWGICVAVN